MSSKPISPTQFIPYLFSFKWLLVIFALADLILTIIRVNSLYDEMLINDINPAHLSIYYYAYPILLLVACVGIQLNNKWSHLLSISASVWLLIRIIRDWMDIANGYGHPMFSSATISSWWNYGNLVKWNLFRFPIALFVCFYAIILLRTSIRHSRNRIKPIPIQ
jgi:hypothetical protein